MRTTLSLLVVSLALCGFGAAAAQAPRGDARPAPAEAQPSNKVQTTSEANSESVVGAAKAPLRDLNLIRTQVPDILIQALADPYARPKTKKCQELVNLIRPLNDALGADLDVPPTAEEQNLYQRGRPMALGAMAGVASDVVPFRGVVRQLSGAARHDQ